MMSLSLLAGRTVNVIIYYRKLIQAAINVQRLTVLVELPENVSSEFKVCKLQPFKYPFRI